MSWRYFKPAQKSPLGDPANWRYSSEGSKPTLTARDYLVVAVDFLVSTLIAFLLAWWGAPIGSHTFLVCFSAFFVGSSVNHLCSKMYRRLERQKRS